MYQCPVGTLTGGALHSFSPIDCPLTLEFTLQGSCNDPSLPLPLPQSPLVFTGPVHRTEKNRRTELNRTMVQSIFRLRLPEFGAIPVAGCQVSKIF